MRRRCLGPTKQTAKAVGKPATAGTAAVTRRLTRQSWPEVGTWEIMYVFQLVFVSVSCDIAHHRRRVLVLPCRTQNGLSECRRERWCACSLPHAMGSQAAGGKGVRGVHAGKCGSGLCMLASVVVACGECGVPLREAVRHVESLRVCLVAIRCMLQGPTSVDWYWAGALLRTLACHVPSVG